MPRQNNASSSVTFGSNEVISDTFGSTEMVSENAAPSDTVFACAMLSFDGGVPRLTCTLNWPLSPAAPPTAMR